MELTGRIKELAKDNGRYNGDVKARVIIENWRMEYNTLSPHSALGNLTPVEFAAYSEQSRADSRLSA